MTHHTTKIIDTPIGNTNSSEAMMKATEAEGFYLTIGKRAIDLLLSGIICLLLLSWILPILAIAIKLDSRGPVFFRQPRSGYKGKIFGCFKLRSMHVNREAHDLQASVGDPRITRVGKFLRISNLDELPQFINVLLGDMSIVGPRPHMMSDSENFARVYPGYWNRYLAKPGITGLAQIKGFRGPTPSERSIYKRLQWDLYYAKHVTFIMDVKIIILTALETLREVFKIRVTNADLENDED